LGTEALADSSQALNRHTLESLDPRNLGFIESKIRFEPGFPDNPSTRKSGTASLLSRRATGRLAGRFVLVGLPRRFLLGRFLGGRRRFGRRACTVADGDAELGASTSFDFEPDLGADVCRVGLGCRLPS
jgi:hypothetical protein